MIFHRLTKEQLSEGTGGKVIALGCFDGFHVGHRGVINAAIALAKELSAEPAVFCFDMPPAFYAPNSTLKILGGDDRLSLFAESGINSVYVADFPDIKDMDARKFIEQILIQECSARGVVCGFNFRFGKNRVGNPELLKEYFRERSITLEPIYYNDLPVSSSRIRAALADGDIELATTLLGRFYTIRGSVSSGRQDGRKIGFPTINQIPDPNRAIPAFGVYITQTKLPDGRVLPSITDVGLAPTLDTSGVIRLETHILDTDITVSPEEISVEFIARIRGEKRFDSIEALKSQISADSEFARSYFATK